MKKFYQGNLLARLAFFVALGVLAGLVPTGLGSLVQYARAASISLNPAVPPLDPAMTQLNLNNLITAINSGVMGTKNVQFVQSGTGADTTEDTLYTYSIPANTLATNGQSLRITCFGNVTNDANAKTVKLYFGATSYSVSVTTSTANAWRAEFLVVRSGASATQIYQSAVQGATPIASAFTADATDALNAAVVTKCTGTNAAAVANDITGQGFIVEILQ
jgi:hypothetical protein